MFEAKLREAGKTLAKTGLRVLQANLGRRCNLACTHCHVEAGPYRTERMDEATARAVIRFLERSRIPVLDLTGGAPELNPHFRMLVAEGVRLGRRVMDRCNLSVFFEEGMSDLPEFLARNGVEIVASLPCYLKENVDRQRGKGTYDASIRALKILNGLGYARPGTGLVLNLVYNPVEPHLPPPQEGLEADYRERLAADWGIAFDRLFALTNMPITRYAKYLRAFGQLEDYRRLLEDSFNPAAVDGLMCRDTLSVGWDGALYDCDFNQMLGMRIGGERALTIFDAAEAVLQGVSVRTADHCFGCTAGAGSSCTGEVVRGAGAEAPGPQG